MDGKAASSVDATAIQVGERIDRGRMCWLGGWDKGKVFYMVMVERRRKRMEPIVMVELACKVSHDSHHYIGNGKY
jgi:hypothetical protein